MKIEIDLLDEISSYEGQFEVVRQYIKKNTESIDNTKFFGLLTSEIPKIKETKKYTGEKIKPNCSWREYHVSCRKTNKGVYKFKVWNA